MPELLMGQSEQSVVGTSTFSAGGLPLPSSLTAGTLPGAVLPGVFGNSSLQHQQNPESGQEWTEEELLAKDDQELLGKHITRCATLRSFSVPEPGPDIGQP